jgi:hypothetical protein
MCQKWMDFGSPSDGKGINTVVLAGHTIRKNQLGNMELLVIASLIRPANLNDKQVAVIGYAVGANGTYDANHPHEENFGPYSGLHRADNLAAFGIGNAIAEEIMKSPGWRKNHYPTEAEILAAIKKVFSNKKRLEEAVNKYVRFYILSTGSLRAVIGVDALFFIPEFGSFNTDSCKHPMPLPKYQGPNSIDYFTKVLYPAWQSYKRKKIGSGGIPYEFAEWVREYRENYKDPKGLP